MNLQERRIIARAIVAAKSLTDLRLLGEADAACLRRLRAAVHPDTLTGDDVAWLALERLAGKVIAPAVAPTVPPPPVELRVGARAYILGDLLARGDLADVYAAECTRGRPSAATFPVVAKVGGEADSDLLEIEAKALRDLHAPAAGDTDAIRRLRGMLPRLVDSFALRSDDPGGGRRRRVNVVERAVGCIDAREVRAAYPHGLDFRDATWMIRRLLAALGTAHARGVVHGAVLPEHLMLQTDEHGAMLVDWCYSARVGEPARAFVTSRRGWYPPEVLAKKPLTPVTDVYMAGMCFAYLLGDTTTGDIFRPATDTPREIQAFIRSMLIEAPARRSSDAWDLHEQLGQLMVDLTGPPKFRKLAMPPRSARDPSTPI